MKNSKNSCYLDASFLVSIFASNHDYHKASTILLVKLLKEKINMFISCLALDETLVHVKVTLEKQVLKEKRKPFSDFYEKFKEIFDAISEYPSMKIIQFENDLDKGLDNVLENIKKYDLRPRDAFHYAMMQDLNIKCIVAKDRHFDKLENKIKDLQVISY